ncbi:acyl carrier protein, partial [Actinoalloteichus caeruleus]
MLRGLVRTPTRRAAPGDAGLVAELMSLGSDERVATVLNLVRTHVVAVLGHATNDAVQPHHAFT